MKPISVTKETVYHYSKSEIREFLADWLKIPEDMVISVDKNGIQINWEETREIGVDIKSQCRVNADILRLELGLPKGSCEMDGDANEISISMTVQEKEEEIGVDEEVPF